MAARRRYSSNAEAFLRVEMVSEKFMVIKRRLLLMGLPADLKFYKLARIDEGIAWLFPALRHGLKIRFHSTKKEFDMEFNQSREPWNEGKLIGQKPSSEKSLYSRHRRL